MKLLQTLALRFWRFLFGQKLYVTTRDGCYTVVTGVRKMEYHSTKVYLCDPHSTEIGLAKEQAHLDAAKTLLEVGFEV
jgi:hypothetical protein